MYVYNNTSWILNLFLNKLLLLSFMSFSSIQSIILYNIQWQLIDTKSIKIDNFILSLFPKQIDSA